MISYEPFWDYLDWHEISTYTLINKHHISSSTINRLRHNLPVSTATIDNLDYVHIYYRGKTYRINPMFIQIVHE